MDANSSAESSMRERQDTYKTTRAQARSRKGVPVWKERFREGFRERCRERVSLQRERLRERLRSNPDDLKPLQSFAKDVFRSELESSRRRGLMTPKSHAPQSLQSSTLAIPHDCRSRDDAEMKSDSGDSVTHSSELSPADTNSSVLNSAPTSSPFSAFSMTPTHSSHPTNSSSSSFPAPANSFPFRPPANPSPFSSSNFSNSHSHSLSQFMPPHPSSSSSSSEFDMRDTESGDQFRFSALSSGDDTHRGGGGLSGGGGFHGGCTRSLYGDAENGIFVSDADEKEILYMIEEELRMQILESEPEGALLQAFEAYEEALVQNEIDDYVASERVSTDEKVLCPVCEHLYLDQRNRHIFCSCGFRLDVESDGLTLSNLRDRLASCMECHREQCPERPKFQVRNQFGITALTVTCGACGCNEIVL